MVGLEYWGAKYCPCANKSPLLLGRGACLDLEIFV